MKTICTFIVAVLFVAVTLGDPYMHRLEKRSGSRYCGPNLVETMKLICNSNYKRSSNDGEYDTRIVPFPSRLVYPFRTASRALHIANSGFRRKRGIVEECCHKPCTINELASYCGRS